MIASRRGGRGQQQLLVARKIRQTTKKNLENRRQPYR